MSGEDASLVPEGNDVQDDDTRWETAPEAGDVQQAASSNLWDRILQWVSGRPKLDMRRLEKLNDAVAQNPKSAVNYVLRGETYLSAGEAELAAIDFEIALELAQKQFERDNWGLVSQALRDRAEHGLQLAQRALKAKRK